MLAAQDLRERLGGQPVIAEPVVEAVGLDLLVTHGRDALQCARDVLGHCGAQCEELQAHLVTAGAPTAA